MSKLAVVLCLAPVALAGCYTYTYTPLAPVPGMQVALDLNDHGRAELQNNVGPEVATVEGTLVSNADSTYLIKVSRTISFRGQTHKWAEEPVTVRYAHVGMVRERKFSTPRTVVAVGTFGAGVVAFVVTRSLLSGGSGGSGGNDPPPPGGQ